MRIFTELQEETLRARKFLTEWANDIFLSREQYQRLEQDTPSDLRTTNIFLRLVLFFFTIIGMGGVVALFFLVFLSPTSPRSTGILLLIFAAVAYTAAEITIKQARLYHYGIEEALLVCSVASLCVGLDLCLFRSVGRSSPAINSFVPAFGAIASLWIWYRCNLWYAFPAAMIFAVAVSSGWTSSPAAQHALIAVFYVVGLAFIVPVRSRHRFDQLEETYSLCETFLWLGLYLILNLKISAVSSPSHWWSDAGVAPKFAAPFYWATWVIVWCLPPIILMRGVRQKDRFLLAVGTLTSVLTLATNKPYLGWQRHTWDPILLGIALAAIAVFLRRWLALGPAGVRHGFTAMTLSGKDKHTLGVGSAVMGLITTQMITPAPQSTNSDFHFGGGSSGGGGASGDF